MVIDRRVLSKRRWQATAPDGAEFGFDLETHLHDQDTVFVTDTAQYIVAQKPEPLLSVPFSDARNSAWVAWSLGNLHFAVEINEGAILVVDDPAVRQFLERNEIPYQAVTAVLHPIKAVVAHGHH